MRNFKIERAALWTAYTQRGNEREIARLTDLSETQAKIDALDREAHQARQDDLFVRNHLKAEAKAAKEQAKFDAQRERERRIEAREADTRRRWDAADAARMEEDKRQQAERDRINAERIQADLSAPESPAKIFNEADAYRERLDRHTAQPIDAEAKARYAELYKIAQAEYLVACKGKVIPEDWNKIVERIRAEAGL